MAHRKAPTIRDRACARGAVFVATPLRCPKCNATVYRLATHATKKTVGAECRECGWQHYPAESTQHDDQHNPTAQ